MGKPIAKTHFDAADYLEFHHRLAMETKCLEEHCQLGLLSENTQESGFELELWLLNDDLKPSFDNLEFIKQVNEPYLIAEISKSTLEMNLPYDALHEQALRRHHQKLQNMLDRCYLEAEKRRQHVITIGTLPTAVTADYSKNNLTELPRYQAIDAYLDMLRNHQPQHLQLKGAEILELDVDSSVFVGAMSSFQIHFRVGYSKSARFYNASQALSSALVALSANAPFLFGKHLWEESRIAFYEQVLKTRNPLDHLARVSFGTGYVKNSVFDLFKENLNHFHPIIPQLFEKSSENFYHLRLHNGTIYRWNRPILGIDEQNKLHFRIEFRPIASGPSAVDMMANAAFYYGITNYYANRCTAIEEELPFERAKYNFYAAAQKGLSAQVYWYDKKINISWLIINVFLEKAREGLHQLELDASDIDYYLSIIEERVRKNQTGSQWQTRFFMNNNADFTIMVRAYLEQQYSGRPVHDWWIK